MLKIKEKLIKWLGGFTKKEIQEYKPIATILPIKHLKYRVIHRKNSLLRQEFADAYAEQDLARKIGQGIIDANLIHRSVDSSGEDTLEIIDLYIADPNFIN